LDRLPTLIWIQFLLLFRSSHTAALSENGWLSAAYHSAAVFVVRGRVPFEVVGKRLYGYEFDPAVVHAA
jgi:hypothetical protein